MMYILQLLEVLLAKVMTTTATKWDDLGSVCRIHRGIATLTVLDVQPFALE